MPSPPFGGTGRACVRLKLQGFKGDGSECVCVCVCVCGGGGGGGGEGEEGCAGK